MTDTEEKMMGHDEEFAYLKRRAANLGYELVREADHPDSPHAPAPTIDDLKAALEPFAKFAEHVAAHHPGWDHDEFQVFLHDGRVLLHMKEFRRAALSLNQTVGDGSKQEDDGNG